MSVPKSIIQIWIGNTPMPAEMQEWCAQWKALHRDWEYRLWGQDGLDLYADDPYLRHLQAEEKQAFVADRLRVLLLRDFGGIYLDCDCFPVRPFRSIQHILDAPEVDFVAGMRSPDRKFIALHRGISFVDNTVMCSAKGGRMAHRLCGLYRPDAKKQTGYHMGLEVLRHADGSSVRLLGYRYFYAEQSFPETICLHDGNNLGSWAPPNLFINQPANETQRSQSSTVRT